MKIGIIGGGISGLSAGTFLDNSLVLEARSTAGGWVQSAPQISGVVHDQAANGWLSNEPAVPELISKLGLQSRLIRASNARKIRWIYHQGQLCPAPLSPALLLRSPLLSLGAKLRLLLSPWLMKKASNPNESVAEFAQRHFGPQVIDTLVAPMVAGIFGARPEELSVDAAFPLLRELEAQGSVFAGIKQRQRQRKKEGAEPPVLTSLEGGMGELTKAMVQHLGERLQLGTEIQMLEKGPSGWVAHSNNGTWELDGVMLACPAKAQARLLPAGPLREALQQVQYADVIVAISEFSPDTFARVPEGFGVLMSRMEQSAGPLGLLFSNQIFPTHASKDKVLTRCILGGTPNPEVIDWTDSAIRQAVIDCHSKTLGPQQSQEMKITIHRHRQAIPCYGLEHPRLHSLVLQQHAAEPSLRLLGNHLLGVGIKDCIRNALVQSRNLQAHFS